MRRWFSWRVLLVPLLLSGCGFFQPVPPGSELRGDLPGNVSAQYPGPRYIVRDAALPGTYETLDGILREHGFRVEGQTPHGRTYLLPRARHPMVDKVRVSFYLRPDGRDVRVFTRTEASFSSFLMFKGSFSDVSNRPQTLERLDDLFQKLGDRMTTRAVRVAGSNS